jgi:formylglycine-generating enzyme required for sulfatase activity
VATDSYHRANRAGGKAMAAQIDRLAQMAKERIAAFERYGDNAVAFAAHAAFPLSLTTELSYCLREKFFTNKADWSIAPQLLLSGLCDRKGHDLYVMDFSVRGQLLKILIQDPNFGVNRLSELADFMETYILAGISNHNLDPTHQEIFSQRSRLFGYPPEVIKYTALSLVKQDSKLTEEIKLALQDLLRHTVNPRDRLQLAMLVENQDDLLISTLEADRLNSLGLTSFSLLDLAKSIAGDTGDELSRVWEIMKQHQFPDLREQSIDYRTVSFVENAVETGDDFYSFEFETVQVDERGKIIDREQNKAFAFREPLAPEIGLEMVAIPSGKFMMGSPDTEHDRYPDESPQHEVTVQPFFIGKYPVTQAQWRVIANTTQIERELNPDPSHFKVKGDNRPVEEVSWEEAVEFCQRLSRETGRDYRLPTEAEWEYACRAGTTTPFHFGKTITGKLANYDSDVTYLQERKVKSKGETTSVGDFPPNAFGLYDMHGNVWEWCLDNWHSNYEGAPTDGSAWLSEDDKDRVLRGGSWLNDPRYCRSASRAFNTPVDRFSRLGFRVVCEIPRT